MNPTRTAPVARRLAQGTGVGLAIAAASVATAASAHAEEIEVRPGDTVSHIALRHGSTVAAIREANGLDARSTIRAGQHLTVPTAAAPVAAAPAVTHTVVAGDTVSAIALRHGTTTAAIVAANGLDARALIRIGQVLTIAGGAPATPAAAAAPAPAPSAATHTVVAGDTVSAIATRYGTTTGQIVAANSLDARALIRIGQVLTVPGATATVGNTFAGRTYADDVVAAANANLETLRATGVPSKSDMQTLIITTATQMGVDPALAQAIAKQESGFRHDVVSPANAIGVMQVIPASGQWASELVGRELNLLDPTDNVVAGVAILRHLVAHADDQAQAIAGYYQGLTGVRRDGMFADTRRYVANVQTLMGRYA